ncbi:MAG: PepSY domain-containing protein [Candidatus Melainabacteria bacterium]|nr:PepSY domain-containing protein [Candidatus Melainabacteria bacterium]
MPLFISSMTGVCLVVANWASQGSRTEAWDRARSEVQKNLQKFNEKGAQWVVQAQRAVKSEREVPKVSGIYFPKAGQNEFQFKLKTQRGEEKWFALNSETESFVLKDSPPLTDSLIQFHRGTWMGLKGRVLMSLSAVLVLAVWIAGLMLRRKRTVTRVHFRLGPVFGLLLLAVVLSGSFLNFVGEWTRFFDPGSPTQTKGFSSKSSFSWFNAEQTALALRSAPEQTARLESLHFQEKSNGEPRTLYYFSDNSRVLINPLSGTVEKISGPGTYWVYWVLPIHSGQAFGRVGSFVWVAVGLLSLALFGSGVSLWIGNRFSRFRGGAFFRRP